ncbi:MAG TPA: hypothetical protein VHG09_08195 [Longimicrobiales bacterium]|nr:hypothetical protein [Longimicrobiales bacterium]
MRHAGERFTVILLLCLLTAACGARSGTTSTQRADRDIITAAEVQAATQNDAFSLVRSLRPQWLSVRGPSSVRGQQTIKVYLDGSLLGSPEQLRQISKQSISSLRYLDGLEATQRWGLDHGAGAIVVSTRGGR